MTTYHLPNIPINKDALRKIFKAVNRKITISEICGRAKVPLPTASTWMSPSKSAVPPINIIQKICDEAGASPDDILPTEHDFPWDKARDFSQALNHSKLPPGTKISFVVQ